MSLRPVISRRVITKLNSDLCCFCHLQKTQSVRRYATPKKHSPTGPRKMAGHTQQRDRVDTELQYREKKFKALFTDHLLPMKPRDASALINDFLEAEKNQVDAVTNMQQLAKKYGIKVLHINFLAIPLLRPTDNDSFFIVRQQSIARRLLLALSAIKDSMATLQILAAVYHSGNPGVKHATAVARLFSHIEIKNVMKILEQLAEEGDTDCMTLYGQFLEKQGQRGPAKNWYERAWEKCSTKYDPKWPHPQAFPRDPPWTALARLLLTEGTPEARMKAKVVLEKGALKAGDPLAYYQLAGLEKETSPQWFTYMNKAAASGHREAAYKLGHFYMNANADPQTYMQDTRLAKALNFVVGWKAGSVSRLGEEWFLVAAAAGYKPAMLELAELHNAEGNIESAVKWLTLMTEPPPNGHMEEWPRLAELAKQRLANPRAAKASSV